MEQRPFLDGVRVTLRGPAGERTGRLVAPLGATLGYYGVYTLKLDDGELYRSEGRLGLVEGVQR